MRGTNLIFIYALTHAIHEVKNYYRGCTHAESLNTCQVLGKQKMEGHSVSGGTSSGSQSGQRKVPQLAAQEISLWVEP